jgi:hypothetical protein
MCRTNSQFQSIINQVKMASTSSSSSSSSPPSDPAAPPVSQTLTKSLLSALKNDNGADLVQLLLSSVDTLPMTYAEKRSHGKNSVEIVKNLASKITNLLDHSFLNVDFKCKARDVNKSTWENVVACRRSDEGSSGIYFIQCEIPSPPHAPHTPAAHNTHSASVISPSHAASGPHGGGGSNNNSIAGSVNGSLGSHRDVIVAKSVTEADFERQKFIHDLAKGYFHIQCPEIRFLHKKSEEFEQLRVNTRKIFCPLFEEMYETGGKNSPKSLFDGPGIMLMEMVNGKPLCHRFVLRFTLYFTLHKFDCTSRRLNGQRLITDHDYRAIGRLFLFDLLIHNSDRLPCRKVSHSLYAGY